jgi:peptidoglycan/xylan/chitin deacetylase (PgdA/CDA1 family)
MGRERHACKYHPDLNVARRCYQCRAYICNDCIIKHDHHLFCSNGCVFRYQLQKYLPKLRINRENLIMALLLLAVQVVFFFLLDSRLERVELIENYTTGPPAVLAPDSFFVHDSGYNVTGHYAAVFGNAPAGSIVGLWRDGRFIASQVSGRKGYRFENQSLRIGKNGFMLWSLLDDGSSQLVDSFTIRFQSRQIARSLRPVDRVPTDQKIVALTFDAGSIRFGATEILHILRTKEVRCTFFLTGQFMRRFPDLVDEIATDDHEVGNHTWSHPHLTNYANGRDPSTLTGVTQKTLAAQLARADSMYESISGRCMEPFWRAPFGELNNEILRWAALEGYRHIGWSPGCDTWDWVADPESELYRTGPQILEKLLEKADSGKLNGAVVLMHLGSDRKDDFPFMMLPKLIDELHERGYRIVTISQLLQLNVTT